MIKEICIGTTNQDKIREIASICFPFGIELSSISLNIPETGETFEENAMLKAFGYADHCKDQVVLAEDSGLVIPYLNGLPGPWSARFADFNIETKEVKESGRSREEIDKLNNEKVLSLMRGIDIVRRGAYFTIVLCLIRNKEVLFKTQTKSHGWISEEPKGENGFGYDPIFIGQNTFRKTYAELDRARKDSRSHRQLALREFRLWLSNQFKEKE